MKLEKQCVNLKLAKELHELGVSQNSLFKWFFSPRGWIMVPQEENTGRLICPSAFTVAELGEMLGGVGLPTYNKVLKKWEKDLGKGVWIAQNTEADARAKLRIYLIKNKLI